MINSTDFAAEGTCTKTRKNLPEFQKKLDSDNSNFNISGKLAVNWTDVQEVVFPSNCDADFCGKVLKK